MFIKGAELIEELRQKRMVEQSEEERRILEKIKLKMDKIKANQQKIQGANYREPESHFVGKYLYIIIITQHFQEIKHVFH